MDNIKIKFKYLYRDAGNYMNWAEVVFSNPDRLAPETITQALRTAFLQDGLFIAHQVFIPEAFFFSEGGATSDDHCFHEFDSVEASHATATDKQSRSIGQFVSEVEGEAARGWVAFDPHDRAPQRILD
jgi:hypothetical protein